MAFEEYWNKIHEKYGKNKPVYDTWLDQFKDIFDENSSTILDLGCGTGNDTLYLIEKGFDVLACDYSSEAINAINRNIPQAKTKLVDISKKLPFKDSQFDIIVADLSLHYFDDKTTVSIMKEIKRILKPNGHLFARVNSIEDINHGAMQGEKIENNFYFVEGYNKRFFDEKDINKYFGLIGKVIAKKAKMFRYEKPKDLLEVSVEKTNEN